MGKSANQPDALDRPPRGYWWARHAPDWLWRWWLDRVYERLETAERAREGKTPDTRPARSTVGQVENLIDEYQKHVRELNEELAAQRADTAKLRERARVEADRAARLRSIAEQDGFLPDNEHAAGQPVTSELRCACHDCNAFALVDMNGEIADWVEVYELGRQPPIHKHTLKPGTILGPDQLRISRTLADTASGTDTIARHGTMARTVSDVGSGSDYWVQLDVDAGRVNSNERQRARKKPSDPGKKGLR